MPHQQTDKTLDYPKPENAPLAYYDCKTCKIAHTASDLFWAGNPPEEHDGSTRSWGWHCNEDIQLEGFHSFGMSLHDYLKAEANGIQTKTPHYLGIILQHAAEYVEKKSMFPRRAIGEASKSLPSEVKYEFLQIAGILKMSFDLGEFDYVPGNKPNEITATIGDYIIFIRPSGNTDYYWVTHHKENGMLDEGWNTTQEAAKDSAKTSLYQR